MRIPGQEPLTASMLAAAPLHEQKQMIGEWLVPLPWRGNSGRGVASLLGKALSGGQMCRQGPVLLQTPLLGDLAQVASAFSASLLSCLKTRV